MLFLSSVLIFNLADRQAPPGDMWVGTSVQVTGERTGSTMHKEVWCDLFAA